MSLPKPRTRMVLSYAYLWAREHAEGVGGREEASPRAVVAARQIIAGREVITVIPLTHPLILPIAVEIPAASGASRLDGARS